LLTVLAIAATIIWKATNIYADVPAQDECGGQQNCIYAYVLFRCDNTVMRPPRVRNLFVRLADVTTPQPDYQDYRLVLESEGPNDLLYSVLVVTVSAGHQYDVRFFVDTHPISEWGQVTPPNSVGLLQPSQSCGVVHLPVVGS
jgi:hypothetical protein